MNKTDTFNLAYIPKHKDVEKLSDYDMLFVDAIYHDNGKIYSNLKILDENIICLNWGYDGINPQVWENESLFSKHITNLTHSVVCLKK